MIEHFRQSEPERRRNREKLEALRAHILEQVPGTGVPSDQPYRQTDLAIDFAEDVDRLDEAAIDDIVALFEAAGARAKVSSIHVNGWFGDFDKRSTSRLLLAEQFDIDSERENTAVAYIGDSPNDEPMFEAFQMSVGVANVADFLDRIEQPPAWVNEARGGAGFVELAEALLLTR
jgi:hydroxymethylpyrimidine pyrophosphatase-like HAD family hydrolase